MGHYLRAEKILTAPLPPSRMPNLPLRKAEGEDEGDDNDENAFGGPSAGAAAGPSRTNGNGHPASGPGAKGKFRESLGGISNFSAIAMPAKLTTNGTAHFHPETGAAGDDDDDDSSWIGDLMRNTKGGVWGALKAGAGGGEKKFERGLRRFGQDEGAGRGEALTEWSVACKYLAALCMVSEDWSHSGKNTAESEAVFRSTRNALRMR